MKKLLVFLLAVLVTNPIATASAATTNLVPNPTLETADGTNPQFWSGDSWGSNTPKFTYPVAGHSSTRAAKVAITAYTDGDAKWYFDEVAVNAGEEYLFSDWYKSNVDTALVAQYHMTDDSYQYEYLAAVPKTGTTWKQTQASIVVPTGVAALTVFHLIDKVGQLTIDDVSLVSQKAEFAQGMVTFSFDDGFKSTYANGLPILDAAGIKSTQAIITKYLSEPEYVTTSQIKDMAARGHEIASHTQTHPDLTILTNAQAKKEINQSKVNLQNLGITATSLVYPYGTYNDSIITLVKNAGYIGARSVDEGYNSPLTDRYKLRDQHITSDVTWPTIKGWIDNAVAKKQWVIFEMHRQDVNGGEFSNDPALLKTMVDYIKAQNVKTVTLSQGIGMMQQ
ncbi:MAG: polysaccharide deacetylase family protein [Candidatus Moranbacteria bacterium]|nr:polysaccharide deacetylase family protein [Candidatus Moranbacteria bacterium]